MSQIKEISEVEDIEDVEDVEETIECEICGCDVSENDCDYLEGTGDVCNECYQENTFSCALCNEELHDGKKSPYILVTTELIGQRRENLPFVFPMEQRKPGKTLMAGA